MPQQISLRSLMRAERTKYKGSMIVRIALGLPFFVAFVYFMAGFFYPVEFMQGSDQPWQLYTMRVFSAHMGFLFPLQVIIAAAGITQVDHQSDMWKHLLVQPVPRWRFFAAKWCGLLAVMAASLAVFVVSVHALGLLLGWIHPGTGLTVPMGMGRSLWIAAAAGIAAMGMAAIQFVIGMRWTAAAAPLAVGIIAFVVSVLVGQLGGITLYLPHIMIPPTVGTLLSEPETWWPSQCSMSLAVCALVLACGLFRFTRSDAG